jgi:hypothetical protein
MTKKKKKEKTEPKSESTLDLSALKRFENMEDQEFRLKKIGSKRASMVGVGQSETGDFSIITYEATDTLPESKGAFITGRGFSFLRTSPIVAITDQDERSTTFETEGGIYKLEMFPTARPEPKTCHKCGTSNNYKDMIMKMGGLLCTKCHVILCEPYVDEEYFNERARRARESEESESEQEGT